jgi:hypothetical protein
MADPQDIDCVLVRSDDMPDWYTLERRHHDHVYSLVKTEYGNALAYSGRLGNACIEGHAHEWRMIANAIDRDESADFKRCAAIRTKDGYEFSSPRNSTATLLTVECAQRIAAEIKQVLG